MSIRPTLSLFHSAIAIATATPSVPRAASAPAAVVLTLSIDGIDARALRLALHRALGSAIGIYAMAVDHARGRTALQLTTSSDELPRVMDKIMRHLPAAEFGVVRCASTAAVH